MKFGVVTFPGSNCDQDMVYVLRDLMGQDVVELWHKDTDLKGAQFIVLPGGFSYGDYLRSGAIAKFSPIMESVIAHANNGGYVMGICNGFQILTESGLLEGALLHNDSQKFICKNVFLKPMSKSAAPTQELDANKTYQIPIAHGEGRYYADEATLASLQANDQILFAYCDAEGHIAQESNPNGSLLHIAGITNKNKNVFGMMPHPERAADKHLNNIDGLHIFESILAHCS
jgi:phosphoribosylformylglycinamidine synthase I